MMAKKKTKIKRLLQLLKELFIHGLELHIDLIEFNMDWKVLREILLTIHVKQFFMLKN